MPNTNHIMVLATQLQTATAEAYTIAESDDDDAATDAFLRQIKAINELTTFKAITPNEVAAKSKACIDLLASSGGLPEAIECTRNLVRSVLEEAATQQLPTTSDGTNVVACRRSTADVLATALEVVKQAMDRRPRSREEN